MRFPTALAERNSRPALSWMVGRNEENGGKARATARKNRKPHRIPRKGRGSARNPGVYRSKDRISNRYYYREHIIDDIFTHPRIARALRKSRHGRRRGSAASSANRIGRSRSIRLCRPVGGGPRRWALGAFSGVL